MELGQAFIRLGVQPENLDMILKFQNDLNKLNPVMEGSGKHTRTLAEQLQRIITPINAAKVAVVGLAAGIVELSKKAADYAFELSKFQTITGLSAQKLQVWQQEAAQFNVSGDEIASTIENIQKAGAESLLTGIQPPWFLLGINPRDNPFDVLNQLQKKIKEFPAAMGKKLAGDIGISDNLLNMLKSMKELQPPDKSLLLSDKEIIRLKEFSLMFNRIWDNAKRTLQKFGVVVLPIAEFIVRSMDKMRAAFLHAVSGVQYLTEHFEGFNRFLKIFTGLMAIGLFPGISALVLLAVALEDVNGFLEGHDSLLGRVMKRYQDWHTIVRDLTVGVAALADVITFGKFGKQLEEMVEDVSTSLNKDQISKHQKPFEINPTSPVGQALQSAMNQSNNITINVNGAGDPSTTATKVKDALSTAVSNTYYQFGLETH